jgi:protease-4
MPQSEVVGIVRIHGAISSESDASANKVVPALKKAFEKANVQSIILSIDSPGGQPAEAERIGEAIASLKAKHKKPITAVIANTGASAAYLIALRADKIVAGHYSLVGSIGAILQGWDVHRFMEKHSIGQRVYASGEHKNMLNPFTPMTDESNARAQGLVDALGGRFVDEVRKYRHGKLPSPLKIGTGEVWTGSLALSYGLIDEIGTIESVMATASTEKAFDFGPRGDPGFFPLPRTVATWLHELQSSLSDLRIGER